MTYVVLQPNSSTNPSDKYRVVDYARWTEHADSNLVSPLPVKSEHDNFAEAEAAAAELNGTGEQDN